MNGRVPPGEREAWEDSLAGRLLTSLDREAVLAECYCPSCDRRLAVEPRCREATLNITFMEETGLRCTRCGFAAAVTYRELRAHHVDRSVAIDGRVVREDNRCRPSHEVTGLDGADIIL
jgi:hypothetical protein